MQLGRSNLDWSQDTWDSIDKAVHDEMKRIMVARTFMPIFPTTADAKTVPADTIDTSDPETLSVQEGDFISIFEIAVGFALTQQQVNTEGDITTAVTLATRAANLLAQAEDILIFQGDRGLKNNVLFTSNRVRHRNNSFGTGLLDAATQDETINVPFADKAQQSYGEQTFKEVAQGYSRLQKKGHYGPYAIVLETVPFADTHAPLKTTLIMPADRITSLVSQWFYGTGTLDPFTGLLISLGGNTMDLAVGMDAITAVSQVDTTGLSQFRVYERIALRLKDPTAIVKFVFEQP